MQMHHEYMVHVIQPLAVRRYLGLAGAEEVQTVLRQTYGAALHYAQTRFWGDSSNKASWLIPDLNQLFPDAKFIHLTRDGRKVAGSYFRKLADECYDDQSNAILQAFYDEPALNPAPPPEKKYWWPVPRKGDEDAALFRLFDQFERISWHWAQVNRTILKELAGLPQNRKYFVRLEDLRASPEELRRLLDFIGLAERPDLFARLQRPHNVNVPQDAPLNAQQRDAFMRLAGGMMAELGYDGRPEYVVKY